MLPPAPSSDGSAAAGDDQGAPSSLTTDRSPRFVAHPLPADIAVVTEIATVRTAVDYPDDAHQSGRDANGPGIVSVNPKCAIGRSGPSRAQGTLQSLLAQP